MKKFHLKMTAFALVLFATRARGTETNSPAPQLNPPNVFVLDAKYIAQVQQRLRDGDATFLPALASLENDANTGLKCQPFTVVSKATTPPSGDKHDYMSEAPYFWPNPATSNGLPYVRHDGERNPDINKIPNHRDIGRMPDIVETLAAAWYFTTNETYAEKATKLLRTWFLDPATRMNPNLEYAQAVLGVNTGRGTGLIESRGLVRVVDAAGLLEGSKSWTQRDQESLKAWFSDFLQWMEESDHGRAERAAKNNHGTYYDVQVMSFALYLGNTNLATKIATEARQKRIAVQIEPDGAQPLELARTRAWSYSVGNLAGLMSLAKLADCVGVDLWNFQTADGRSICKALDYLTPYACGDQKWSHKQLGGWSSTGYAPLLRQAALHFPDRYIGLVKKLPHVPSYSKSRLLGPDVLETFPIRSGN